MTATIVQNGYTLIIVGTAQDIVNALVSEGYPEPKAITMDNTTNGLYHVIAYRLR